MIFLKVNLALSSCESVVLKEKKANYINYRK